MNSNELLTLAHICQSVALGARWECKWERATTDEPDGWGAPCGRDLEHCIANRIPVRLVPADLGEPAGERLVHNPECPRAYALFMRTQGCSTYDMYAMACRLETERGEAMKNLASVTGMLNDLTAKQSGYIVALDHSAGNVDAGAADVISAARAVAAERYRPGSDWECLNGKIGELCDVLERYYGRPMAELGNACAPRVDTLESAKPSPVVYDGVLSATTRPPVPAFPQPLAFNPNGEAVTAGAYMPNVDGVSDRFIASAFAMVGYLAGRNQHPPSTKWAKSEAAKACIGYADALLAELNGKGEA